MSQNCFGAMLTMTVLIFFSATARAWVVTTDFGPNFYWRLFYGNISTITAARFKFVPLIGAVFLAGTVNIFFVGAQFTEIGFFLAAFLELRMILLNRNG